MRLNYKRCVLVFIVLFIAKLTWSALSRHYGTEFTQTCSKSEQYQEDLHNLTDGVHLVLENLNLTHFLCYGSLWGEIRISRLLPWEEKSVMCLLNEELSKKDEVMIVRMFKKMSYDITYHGTNGEYVVTKIGGDKKMKVELIVFELDSVVKMYRRIGWYRRVMPPSCESIELLDCFPPRLVAPPLQKKQFGKSLIPVPREGIEIQKYHYKKNWWKEVPLKNC